MTKSLAGNLFRLENVLNLLLVFVPVAFVLHWLKLSPVAVFFASAMAIIPLAGLMGRATEALASKLGEGIGGLLNATFGNAAELIIALMALRAGLHDLVKASITGSIIGNILLVFGLSIVVAGYRSERLTFNRTAATMGSTLLTLGGIGLIVPAVFHNVAVGQDPAHELELSTEIAIVLFLTYVLSLFFVLKTHSHLYTGASADHGATEESHWGKSSAAIVLIGATVFVALMSELLVESIEHAASALGMTDIFVGVILVAIIGNAAEHSTAVLVALKNRMDLSMNIAVGSSLQIALFVAPVLVLVSYLFGDPMDLRFTNFEVIAVVISGVVINLITSDGESNWMEGVQLLAVYVILAIAFYFLPA
ncbi:MAG: calcium/proton exchanger [Acidobacteria bacterium]|nr:MAG: calcium/proton exchanger [Acidobacteriota bacterium]